jgi:hypothetical protein
MVEKYSLLPDNHFGARPRRSAEQALNILVERIYQAWRGGEILSLVSFDVKGAFNGVHTSVLTQRLAETRVPKPMVEWIGDFVSNRHAQVTVGKSELEVSEIEFASIPQGSPLSPLLYVFYNANLVEKKIDRRGGAIGFVNDFNAWVVGVDESETTATIQRRSYLTPNEGRGRVEQHSRPTKPVSFTLRKGQIRTIPQNFSSETRRYYLRGALKS